MVLLLLAPALWNGFPLIFPDTGGYVTRPIEARSDGAVRALWAVSVCRRPAIVWPNAIVQSALTVWLVVLTMRAHGFGGRPWLAVGIVAMLTVCTSLPCIAGH